MCLSILRAREACSHVRAILLFCVTLAVTCDESIPNMNRVRFVFTIHFRLIHEKWTINLIYDLLLTQSLAISWNLISRSRVHTYIVFFLPNVSYMMRFIISIYACSSHYKCGMYYFVYGFLFCWWDLVRRWGITCTTRVHFIYWSCAEYIYA